MYTVFSKVNQWPQLTNRGYNCSFHSYSTAFCNHFPKLKPLSCRKASMGLH